MFKNAGRKIAHNTTDLWALQHLIIVEKANFHSLDTSRLQMLSGDFARASDALSLCGQGEGEDLADTLAASNALLLHFANALCVLANYKGAICEQMKANNNLQQLTNLLNTLRDEIRQTDADIAREEAGLGDFKRSGHVRTEFLMAETAPSVSQIVYSPEPNPNATQRTIRALRGSELPAVPSFQQRRMSMMSANGQGPLSLVSPSSPGPVYAGLPYPQETGFNILAFLASTDQMPQPSFDRSVSEFGFSPQPNQTNSLTAAERERVASPRGARFAYRGPTQGSNISTNPYISSPPMTEGDRAPSIEIDHPGDNSFSSSVVQALGHYSLDGSSAGASSSRFNAQPPVPPRDTKNGPDFGPQRYSPPPLILPAAAALSRPPAAIQEFLRTPDLRQETATSCPISAFEDEKDGLAYMSPSGVNESAESLPHEGDRRVHLGGVADVDEELQKRHEEQEKAATGSPPRVLTRVPVPPMDEGLPNSQNGRTSPEVLRSRPASPTHPEGTSYEHPPPNPPLQDRIPSPLATLDPMDVNSFNAAAARKVSRELDALMISSPPQSPAQSQPPPSPFFNRPHYGIPTYQRLPALNMRTPTGPHPTSPKLEGIYVRQRDQSEGSPPSRGPTNGSNQRRPSFNIPSTDTNGTLFLTPMSTPSIYNLPATTGSNTSFQSGASRTISAAAIKLQQAAAARNMSSGGLADVSRLNEQGIRSVSTPYMGPPGIDENQCDYISAYTNNPDRTSGYGSGRFATNPDDGNGIR
ncbi:hypothetical protein L227DRAFT_642208 [Lentinus tigrinus ALCF2SS1-6]|uniref:Uncharacterized protein n=1 Tax=Lentinus tigrinus ALCF2SS1-6 TaxID=1328759 RepID=A0A5C2RT94_9APHY|nr:hypothetical protein L227DRAFT_642208 [Lentinus tigrinus ALCF2SS1-6]